MELALEAVKSTNLVYYEKHQHEEDKEFFQHVPNMSDQELQSIQAAFVDGSLNLAALPDCVRPRDALGEACPLQLIIEHKANGE